MELNKANLGKPEESLYFLNKTLFELSKTNWIVNKDKNKSKINKCADSQPYIRGCKWSPDGTCCLCIVNNDGQHLFDLSNDLYNGYVKSSRSVDLMNTVVHVKEAGLVYDFCWFPFMNSQNPDSSCWLTTKQHSPIQLWDAYDGTLRCTYRGYNNVDEMEPALTVTFSADGSRIYAGYRKTLRTFDTDRPGRDCSLHKIKAPASCLLDLGSILVVGSWNTTISLYNTKEDGTFKSIGKLNGHRGGITHMSVLPDGLLVTGARKDNKLNIWDLRYYKKPVVCLTRCVETNQRIYFDISDNGRYLMSGGSDGVIRVWDVKDAVLSSHSIETDPALMFPLHNDCCNSVSFNPNRPIIATGSGQYHHRDPVDQTYDEMVVIQQDENLIHLDDSMQSDHSLSEDSDNSSNNSVYSPVNDSTFNRNSIGEHENENSLVFWWIADIDLNNEINIT